MAGQLPESSIAGEDSIFASGRLSPYPPRP